MIIYELNKHSWGTPGMFIIFAFVLIANCCNVQTTFNTKVTHQIDSLEIRTDSLLASTYTSATIYKTDSMEYLFLMDSFLKIISVLDIKSKKFLFNIRLREEGPNAIQNLGWLQPLSPDTIVSISNDYFHMFNSTGELIKKISFNGSNSDLSDFDFTQYKPLLTSNNSLLIKDSTILLAKARLRMSPTNSDFYANTLICGYNYVSNSFYDLDIYFPEKYRLNDHNFDLNTYPVISIKNSTIYFNYPFSDAVYTLDKNEAVTVYQSSRNIIDPLPNRLSTDVIQKAFYMDTSPRYKALLFD